VIERVIPRSGESLPVIGLGTWQTFDVGPSDYTARAQGLQRFVDLGGRLVDTSPMYGRAEKALGAVADGHGLHDRLFFATKVWTRGAAAGVAQMHDSLAKLGVPSIDLMQVHNLVDVEAHLDTLAEWKAAGRVRYVGVTHYTVESHRQLEPFLGRGLIDFVQCNYSLAVRDAEARLLPLAAEHGVATVINRPFESGAAFTISAGRPLPPVARELGCETWAQAFLKYVISHPAVTCVIPATSSLAHLEQNMAAGFGRLPDAAERRALVASWEGAGGGA
jgi:aryl-alcohol dehydrogenase-like predicted oxidoreductase